MLTKPTTFALLVLDGENGLFFSIPLPRKAPGKSQLATCCFPQPVIADRLELLEESVVEAGHRCGRIAFFDQPVHHVALLSLPRRLKASRFTVAFSPMGKVFALFLKTEMLLWGMRYQAARIVFRRHHCSKAGIISAIAASSRHTGFPGQWRSCGSF